MNKLISIIVPVYNEEKNIASFYHELSPVLSSLSQYDFEVIFINDGSKDGSDKILTELAGRDGRVKYLEFSRNFGKEAALSAGLNNCSGAAAVMIDADLQHPVNLIPEFLKKWESGWEVVVGVRKKNRGAGLIKNIGSSLFYFIMAKISETKMTARATDYRLLDRKVIDEFNRFTEKNRITRGLIAWLGFKRDFIEFEARERSDGRPSYTFYKLTRLAFSSFVTHSLLPLRIAGYLGIFITLLSAFFGLFILIEQFIFPEFLGLHFSGPAMLAILNLFLIGIVLICLGFIALYIGNIHGEVSNRPLYVVRKRSDTNDTNKCAFLLCFLFASFVCYS